MSNKQQKTSKRLQKSEQLNQQGTDNALIFYTVAM